MSILGYSWGEVLSAIYASLDGAGEERRDIKNLVLQSAHIDFDRDDSILACWFRRLPIDEIVRGLDGGTAAVVDGRFINMALLMRNPAVHFQDALRFAACMGGGNGGGRQQGEEALQLWSDAARIAAWLSDSPVLPTPFFEAFIRNLYQQNQLVRKRLEVTGWGGQDAAARTADLQRITVPLLNVVGDFDDICPPAASLPVMELASSRDKQQIRFPEGHIELCVSAHAHRELWPQVVEWLRSRD